MGESTEVVVIGAGEAGLAVSYLLTQGGVRHGFRGMANDIARGAVEVMSAREVREVLNAPDFSGP
jgi:cation diffusion facilitator CzcD-associated flavoprotein CzcO